MPLTPLREYQIRTRYNGDSAVTELLDALDATRKELDQTRKSLEKAMIEIAGLKREVAFLDDKIDGMEKYG